MKHIYMNIQFNELPTNVVYGFDLQLANVYEETRVENPFRVVLPLGTPAHHDSRPISVAWYAFYFHNGMDQLRK
jgi:hypothetical protein